MNPTHQKIKRQTLAIEASLIHAEEHKITKAMRKMKAWARRKHGTETPSTWPSEVTEALCELHARRRALRNHRTGKVRDAARISHLAGCALRGTPYRAAEAKAEQAPVWKDIEKEVLKFGGTAESWTRWFKEATTPLPVASSSSVSEPAKIELKQTA